MSATVGPRLEVLLVEDDPAYARLLREILAGASGRETYQVTHVATLADATAAMEAPGASFDIVLLDLGLPDADGLESLHTMRRSAKRSPIVVLSGQDDVDTALRAMRAGAQEYLVKGHSERALLPRAIRYATERKRLQDFEQMLIAVVGHDLRGPLQTITLACGGMRGANDDAQREKLIVRAQRAAARANLLIHDVLDLTRIRMGGSLPLERTDGANLTTVAEDVIEEHRIANPARAFEIAAAPGIVAYADRGRIGQVVGNLVGNAVQHSPASSAIRVELSAEGPDAVLRVRNSGPVIPPDVLARIFEPLERSPSAKPTESRSIGLGLYIVSEIVKGHEGSLSARSSEADGTVFEVRIPIASQPAPPRR